MTIYALPPVSERERFREFTRSDPVGVLGVDVETTAITDDGGVFDPAARMRLIQFGTETDAFVLDPHDPLWRTYVRRALRASRLRFVSHTNYDVLWIRREFGVDLAARGIDAHVMACLLFPGERADRSLKGLCDRLIDTKLSEAETALTARFKELAPVHHRVGKKLKTWGFNNTPLDDEVYTEYAGLDAIYVRRLLSVLSALVKTNAEADLSRREQQIKRLANDMQWRGMLIDREHTEAILREVEREYQAADAAIVSLAGCRPKSPRMAEWLGAQGVEFTKLTPAKRGCLDKTELPLLAARYPDVSDDGPGAVLHNLLTLSTGQNMLNNLRIMQRSFDATGLVHPSINTQQAVTGRMSVTNPAMQTFKKTDPRLRACFIARDGHVLVGADYDSQELRLAAAFSRDPSLLDILARGVKQHAVTAERIFGKNYTDEQYKYAKILNFAQQYGAGPAKIGDQMGLPRGRKTDKRPEGEANAEAVRLWKAWRETYAGLVKWSERMQFDRVVVNPWGRRIPQDKHRPYANGNYAIQSSGRDVLGDAIITLHERGWSQYLWMLIHDEIVLEVPTELADEAVTVLEKAMRCEVLGVELTATGKILGPRWGIE